MCLYTEDGKFENIAYCTESPFSLPGAYVEAILSAPNDNLWLGVKRGFISLFDTNKKRIIKNFKYQQSEIPPAYLTQDSRYPNLIWVTFSAEENLVKLNTVY